MLIFLSSCAETQVILNLKKQIQLIEQKGYTGLMKQHYKGILFDLDGTLIDSKQDIAKSVNETLIHLGLDEIHTDKIFSFIGNGVSGLMYKAIRHVLQDEPSRLLDAGISLFQDKYKKHLLEATCCYPGVIDFLHNSDEFRKGIITNKPKALTTEILDGLGIQNFFDIVIGGDEVVNKKPNPEGILRALKEFKLNPQTVLMVGDSYTDIEGGDNASILTCFVTYGYGDINEIQPHYTINQFSDITNCLYKQ